MATYRFIGDVALLHNNGVDIELTQFGQKIELTEEQAKLDLGNRVPLLPESQWKTLGISDDQLSKYGTAPEQLSAPVAFLAAKQKAIDMFVRDLVALFAPKPEPAPPVPAAPEPEHQDVPEESAAPVAGDPQKDEAQ